MILFDTSAIYALANRDDPNHDEAQALFGDALSRTALLVHSYIVGEAAALLQSRIGVESALRFLRQVQILQVHWITADDHHEATRLLEKRNRRGLSLVDCSSFVIMRKYSMTEAFAFDSDFEREGFIAYSGHR